MSRAEGKESADMEERLPQDIEKLWHEPEEAYGAQESLPQPQRVHPTGV
jgi:hypothetical protein